MKELWEQAILPCNLPITILLGMVVVFWTLKILGGVDASLDADDPHDIGGDVSMSMLRVVNAGAVPLTIILSILILTLWIGSILLNYYFNEQRSGLLSAGLFLAAFVLAVIATKIITQPLVPLMRSLKAAEDVAPVIGQTGVVRSIEINDHHGQVEVLRPGGAPAILNARIAPDAEPAPRGTAATVVSFDETSGVYLVRTMPVHLPSIDPLPHQPS